MTLSLFSVTYKDYDSLLDLSSREKLASSLVEFIKNNDACYYPYLTLANICASYGCDSGVLKKLPEESFARKFTYFLIYKLKGDNRKALNQARRIRSIPSNIMFLRELMDYLGREEICRRIESKCSKDDVLKINILSKKDSPSLRSFFEKSIKEGSFDELIASFNLYSMALERQRNLQKLLDACNKIFKFFTTKDVRFPIGDYYYHLGRFYRLSGNLDKAVFMYEKAVREYRRIRDFKKEAVVLTEEAEILEKKGDINRAIFISKKVLQIPIIEANQFVKASLILSTGLLKLRNVNEAEKACRKALSMPTGIIAKVKLLHQMWVIGQKKGSFLRLKYFPYIVRAYRLSSEIEEEKLPSIEKKYEFLKEKASIFRDYSKAQIMFGMDVISAILFLSFIVLAIYFLIVWIRNRRARIVGPYIIKQEIAAGGMGNVYKAIALDSGEEVALKILKKGIFDEESAERFKREMLILKDLKHPNVVRYLGSGQHGEILYYAMELIDGEDLRSIIEKIFPISLKVAIRILEEILDGLLYIHGKGIVHMDIKPSNIMIVGGEKTVRSGNIGKGRVKIMDFGIAKREEVYSLTTSGKVLGTPYFVPPELIEKGDTDHRGDIYSLGVTLYWMFTKENPFYHSELATVLYKILKFQPLPPSEINPEIPRCLDEIIMCAMEKNPENRYQDVKDFLEELYQCEKEMKELQNER